MPEGLAAGDQKPDPSPCQLDVAPSFGAQERRTGFARSRKKSRGRSPRPLSPQRGGNRLGEIGAPSRGRWRQRRKRRARRPSTGQGRRPKPPKSNINVHRRIAGFRGTPKHKCVARRGLGVEACKLDATSAAPRREHGQMNAVASEPDRREGLGIVPARGATKTPRGRAKRSREKRQERSDYQNRQGRRSCAEATAEAATRATRAARAKGGDGSDGSRWRRASVASELHPIRRD